MVVSPPNHQIESCAWEFLDSAKQRFWLLWIMDFGETRRKIESLFPIQARWHVRGWGNVELRYEALRPDFLLRWGDVLWGVTQRGLMWSSEDPLFSGIGTTSSDLPLVEWSSDLMAPVEPLDSRKVHPALLPVGEVLLWIRGMEEAGWLDRASQIRVERQGGRFCLRLILDIHGLKNVTLLLPDRTGTWKMIAQALEPIINDNRGESGLTIDGTYQNKIIVK